MSEKNIPILIFNDSDSDECGEVYHLNKAGEGDRFFSNLENNTERGIEHKITLEMWDQKQCDYAAELGDLMAGHMTDAESDAFHEKYPSKTT